MIHCINQLSFIHSHSIPEKETFSEVFALSPGVCGVGDSFIPSPARVLVRDKLGRDLSPLKHGGGLSEGRKKWDP